MRLISLLILITLFSCTKQSNSSPDIAKPSSLLIRDWKLKEIVINDSIRPNIGIDYIETFTDSLYNCHRIDYDIIPYTYSSDSTKLLFKGKTLAGSYDYHIIKLTKQEFWYYIMDGSAKTYYCEYHMIPN